MSEDKNDTNIAIDENLYSRQILTLGMETMEKISQLKLMIIGLRGFGIEIAKNIILSGPNKLVIFDPTEVSIQDLGSNFYLSEKDIGKRRDESCLSNLRHLNKYVKIDYLKEITKKDDLFKINDFNSFNVIVITEILSQKDIFTLNEITRKNKICLIYSVIFGLSSFIFTDFGPNFTIFDGYGLKKRKFTIKRIEKSEKGLVEIEWPDEKKNPKLRKYIIFKDVEGMNEINYTDENKRIFKVEHKSETEFYIGNTLDFGEYKSGGYIEEISEPLKMKYESFEKKLEDPFNLNSDEVNHKKKFIFLVFKAILAFFDIKGRLPLFYNENDYEEVISITKEIINNLNYENIKSFEKNEIIFDENIIKNICFTCKSEIPCMTSFIGGIVCQEIIKATGKFTPINQFAIFDFLEYSTLIPNSFKSNEFKKNTRYDELFFVFGEKVVSKIKNLNILLAGAGALGCELLKNLALLGISNSVLIIDDDKIEISNLNRQFLFHEEHKGLSKAEVASNSAKEINKDIKIEFLNKRISPKNKDIFNKKYFNNVDYVLGAIDSPEGNYYLVKQCELYEKIFIKGGTNKTAGKSEIFIPNITCSFNDIEKVVEENEEKIPSCTRREFPKKIEDCIDNARDLFDEYFRILIIDIKELINNKDIDDQKLLLDIEISMNKFNLINTCFNLFKLDNQNDLEVELIKFSLNEFNKLFVEDIKKIYNFHPIDDTEESKTFWSDKKHPDELNFDIDNKLCLEFLFFLLKIVSNSLCLNISFINDINIFKEKLNEVLCKKEEDSIINYSLIEEPKLMLDTILLQKSEFNNNSELLGRINNLKIITFEKDIPSLGHIQFIHSFANLKAKSYKIPLCDKFYTLKYTGKIAPTIITSTAIVSGYMIFQMIGIIINQMFYMDEKKNLINLLNKDDEIYEELQNNALHNLCFNLVNNNYIVEPLYEPIDKGEWDINDLMPKSFPRWLKIEEKGNKSIEEFINYINNKYGVNVTLILSAEDDRKIFEKFRVKKESKLLKMKIKKMEKLKSLKLEDVYFNTSKEICNNYDRDNEIFLKINGFSNDEKYIEFPVMLIKS